MVLPADSPEPAVVAAMRGFKRALLAREASQMREMARRWLQVESALDAQISTLAYELAEMRAAGESVSRAQIYQLQRYRLLQAQVRKEFDLYAGYADQQITRGQEQIAGLGVDHSSQAIQLSFWPDHVGAYFDRLPSEAVEFMVGLAGDGSPLGKLLKQRMTEESGAFERLTETLVQGTAQGWNPRKTARQMRDDLAGGLDKALTIARTEQLRVYREAGRMQYEASGVVREQKRLTAHDGTVCAACLAAEGQRLPVSVTMYDHPKGRCTAVPVVDGMPEVTWLAGEAWLETQPEAVQQQVLGPGRWEAWRDGLFEFSRLAVHTHDATWGGSLTPAPLSKLVGRRSRRRSRAPAVKEPVKKASGTDGKAVSAALRIPTRGKYNTMYQATLDSIDQVHDDGELPEIPVKTRTFGNGTKGQYVHAVSGAAVRIDVDPKGGTAETTLAHEAGHFLDHQALGKKGKFESAAAARGAESALAGWWKAIDESAAVRDLRNRKDRPENYRIELEYELGGRTMTYTSAPSRRYLGYALDPRELWARSYAQYIGTRSGNRAIQEQLAQARENKLYPGLCWSDEDFEPIARAIDEIFEVLGWLKKS